MAVIFTEKIRLQYQSYPVTVYHRQGDTDEKIVFLHGGGVDSAMMSWKEVINLMDSRYDLYAVDLLGYGESGKPDIEYSIPLYVELLHSVLEQLGIERTVLAGLSLGGGVCLGFSLKYPQTVSRLILTDTMGLCERVPFHSLCRWFVRSPLNLKSYDWVRKSKKLLKWELESVLFGDKKKITDELVDSLFQLIHEPDCGKPFASFQRYEMGKAKITTELTPHLSELNMPVLLVNGEKDSGVPVRFVLAAAKVIPDCRVHIMKGCRHWAQKERPEEYVKVLTGFLGQKPGGPC